jgi:hypothetical protein
MTEKHQRLLNLDNSKLMDVVKNYRQYGFDDEFREKAISILEERGISIEDLKLTGNFENKTFDYAKLIFQAFRRNSTIAFVMYLILFFTSFAPSFISSDSEGVAIFLLIASISSLIIYVVFLIKSFMSQNQYYKLIGQDYGSEGALLYLFFGMPFYMIMYFFFRNQMKEKMNMIK